MTDRFNQHALSDDLIYLRSTTGREWRLRPVRPVAPAVQLVQDVTRPTAPPLTLKTVVASSEDALRLALDDAAVWHRALKSDPRHILPLLDVAVHRPNIYFITPYCPGGDLTIQRSERAALRYTALVAAAVEIIISIVHQPAHANLSPAHVLLDHAAVPRVAGWGLSRAQRLNSSTHSIVPNELDDVRALAAVLYSMLYGHRFDKSRSKLPDAPSISPLTQDLLRGILIDNCVPELTVFRYDLAAARGLVPPCGPALTPLVNKQREQLLGSDLDSLHGLNPPQAVPKFSQRAAPVSPPAVSNVTENSFVDQQVPASPKLEPSSVTKVVSAENLTDLSLSDTVRAVTAGDLSVASDALVENLIGACNTSDQAPMRIFKVFFQLPISKNPIVAFKVAMILHRFLAEGPAKLTAQSVTNDDFLKWMESSWTRERIRNKSGKVHTYTYCFATGEIAEYTSLIRKRCEVHSNYTQSFTTRWMVRANGFEALGTKRRDAFRGIVGINEKCSAVLRKVATCGGPAAEMKRFAVPTLVTELSKSYTILCWIYSMTPDDSRREIFDELSIAHRATRSSLNIVMGDDELSKKCHPAALFDMDENVDTSFTESDLISTLKKFRKKKKRKPVVSASNSPERSEEVVAKSSSGIVEESFEHTDSARRNNVISDVISKQEIPEASENGNYRSRLTNNSSSSATDDEKSKYDEPDETYVGVDGQQPDLTREHRYEGEHHVPSFSRSSRLQGSRWEHELNGQLSNPESRATIPVNGLKKLSVSVRKGNYHNGLQQELLSDPVDMHRGHSSGFENGVVCTPIHHEPANEASSRRERGTPPAEDEEWIVDEEPNRRSRKSKSGRNKKEGRHRKGGKSSSRKQPTGIDSDGTSEDMEGDDQKQKNRKGKLPRKISDTSSNINDAIGSDEIVVKHKDSERKSGRKKLDEKSIPFDKNPPLPKKKSTECSKKTKSDANTNNVDDYSGGSKEALAAAAQGRKTPVMNPVFEIAPYEVHDGPQVGSGGFGVVYKAKYRTETVAVKKIHKHALSNAASVSEFQSEVAVLCTLRHPNILRFVGACTKPPNLMIVTEFMAGGTLFDLLHQSQTRVTWPMRKRFALDTCRGMRYLHDSKLLHRDLKSSNLMLDKEYNCKVGDFGLTRISRGSAAVQMTGQCGTFQYMAVEVLANKPYSEKADVFSFGILLWEMIARKLPYFGMQPMQVGIAVLQQGLRPTIPPKTPLPLCNMMRACWDNDPNRRPSFAQLVEALESMPE